MAFTKINGVRVLIKKPEKKETQEKTPKKTVRKRKTKKEGD